MIRNDKPFTIRIKKDKIFVPFLSVPAYWRIREIGICKLKCEDIEAKQAAPQSVISYCFIVIFAIFLF